jgi:hypothetical protein
MKKNRPPELNRCESEVSMTGTAISFELNHKSGVLEIRYEANQSAVKSGFDLFAGNGFDVNLCLGYPTMHAFVSSYEGTGYYTASAWIQVVTRREFASVESVAPEAIITAVDVHPTLEELGVPFFAMGFPAEIYDAPCNNLGSLGKLEWIADTFLVTMPSRINNNSISRIAGFRWGYCEYDLGGKRQVEIKPVIVTELTEWAQHLPLLRSRCGKWEYHD